MDLEEEPASIEGISSVSQQNNTTTQVIQSHTASDTPTLESSESGNQLVLTAATPEQLAQLSQHIHSEQDTQNAIALFRTTLDYALELHSHTSTFFQATALTYAHHEHLTSLRSIQDELKTLPPRLEEADKTKLVRTRVNIRNSIATMQQAIDNFQQSSSKDTSINGSSSHSEEPANTVTAEMKNLHTKLVRNRQLVRQAEVDQATTSNQYYAASEKCTKLKNAQQELLRDFTRQFGRTYEDFLDQHPDCSQSYSEAARLQAPSLPTGTHVPDFTAITPLLQPPLKMLPERVLDIPDKPLKGDCYLCRRLDHWSFLCTDKATLQQREDVYKERGACTSCARTHTGVCTQKPRHVCNWFHCCAVDQHHTALCPVAPYPITQEKVTQWYRQLHALQKLYPTERLRKRKEQSRQQ